MANATVTKIQQRLIIFLFSIISPLLQAEDLTLDPIKVQFKWQHQFQFAGYYAAKEQGFYREAGLDVRFLEAQPGEDPVDSVLNGQAQFGVGTSELLLHRYHGKPVVVLGVIFQHSPLSLITLKNQGLDNIHQLGGRKLMIEPSSAELFAYLQQEGFTPKAYDIIEHSANINDLISGKVDAMSVYMTDEPFLLQQRGIEFNSFTPRMSAIDFYGDNFFTLESQIEQNPERVDAFYQATIKGWRYAMQHPHEIIQLIHETYSQRHSIAHLQFEAQVMQELMRPMLIEPGYMNIGRWHHIAQTYHSLGLLPEKVDVVEMLYFPNDQKALAKLHRQLLMALFGLILLSGLSLFIWRHHKRTLANKERLDTIFMNAPLGMIVIDQDFSVRQWNSRASQIFNLNSGEAFGQNLIELIVPEHQQASVEQNLNSVFEQNMIVRAENNNLKKGHEDILCEWLNAPFKDQSLKSTHIICMVRDITQQKQMENQLRHAAHYDNLTALPNRALTLELLKTALSNSQRHKTKVAVLFIDLNDFKPINDSLGHQMGDLLLQKIANRLTKSLRTNDHVGRLAGDEFIVILQDIHSLSEAKKVADNLKSLINQPCEIDGQNLSVHASIGISLAPDDSLNLDKLIQLADQSMYEDKQSIKR